MAETGMLTNEQQQSRDYAENLISRHKKNIQTKYNKRSSFFEDWQREYINERKRLKVQKESGSNSEIIFTGDITISLYNGEISNNSLIIGGSGVGKTWSVVLPNILQAHSSYVVTDPKGDVYRRTGKFLLENGYKIKVLNLYEMDKSLSYNPFAYLTVENEDEVMTLIETIMNNTDAERKSSDPFWDKGEQLFVQSVFYYMLYEIRKEEQNIPKALEIMRLAEVKENNENYISDYDALMLRLGYDIYDIFEPEDYESYENEWNSLAKEERDYYEEQKRFQEEYRDNHIAYVQYKHFKTGAGKTAKSIIISAVARLAPFNINALKNISLYDEMELDKIGEEKTALFVVIPPTKKTFSFVSGMMFTQLFNELNKCANVKHAKQGARLPIPVRFIMDEFANTGKVPDFVEILAYARSLNISIMPILQSLEQLKKMYEKEWQIILDNCSAFMYLGGVKNMDTLEYISKLIGKGTFDKKSFSVSKGMNGSSTIQHDKVGVELMTPDKLSKLKKTECILIVTGYNPVYTYKYKLTKHKNYSKTEDGGYGSFEINQEEIKNKQEMYRLYIKELNKEEKSNFIENFGEGIEKVISKMNLARNLIKKSKTGISILNEKDLNNIGKMNNRLRLYSGDELLDVYEKLIKENKREEKQLENVLDNALYQLKVLDSKDISNLIRYSMINVNSMFTAVDSMESFIDGIKIGNEESTNDGIKDQEPFLTVRKESTGFDENTEKESRQSDITVDDYTLDFCEDYEKDESEGFGIYEDESFDPFSSMENSIDI